MRLTSEVPISYLDDLRAIPDVPHRLRIKATRMSVQDAKQSEIWMLSVEQRRSSRVG